MKPKIDEATVLDRNRIEYVSSDQLMFGQEERDEDGVRVLTCSKLCEIIKAFCSPSNLTCSVSLRLFDRRSTHQNQSLTRSVMRGSFHERPWNSTCTPTCTKSMGFAPS
jgi:hypothetical protein